MINKTINNMLTSQKYTIKDKKIIFIGEVTQTIYNKSLFTRNKDLHAYITLFENSLSLNSPFKDYLYRSRTLLTSRVTRAIYNEQDSSIISELIYLHINFIKDSSNTQEKTNKIAKQKDDKKKESLLENFLENK